MLPDLEPFLELRRYIVVAHHVPGRIRLKLRPVVLPMLPKVDASPYAELLGRLSGVKAMRVNRAALSAIVEYDTSVISMSDWNRLLAGDQDEVEHLLTRHLG